MERLSPSVAAFYTDVAVAGCPTAILLPMPWEQASVLPCQAFANGDHLAVLGDTVVCTGADAGAPPRTGPQGPMSVSIYSAHKGTLVRNLHGHARDVRCVALDGDIVASGDCEGGVSV